MNPIRIQKMLDSETLHLPELRPLIGQTVEITIEELPAPAVTEAFYESAGRIPQTEAEWQSRRETLAAWRTDPRFKPYWPVIDHMLTADFAAARRWAAAAEAIHGLTHYDFDAWREQREFDRLHAADGLARRRLRRHAGRGVVRQLDPGESAETCDDPCGVPVPAHPGCTLGRDW